MIEADGKIGVIGLKNGRGKNGQAVHNKTTAERFRSSILYLQQVQLNR